MPLDFLCLVVSLPYSNYTTVIWSNFSFKISPFDVRAKGALGTLRSNDADDNENVKKQ